MRNKHEHHIQLSLPQANTRLFIETILYFILTLLLSTQ